MQTKSKNQQRSTRFSQLLLEHGEKILLDWAVLYGSAVDGRLRLCSKSVVFEPMDANLGIMRFPLERMMGCPSVCHDNGDVNGSMIEFQTTRYFCMKARNCVAPFECVSGKEFVKFRFKFLHSAPGEFLEVVEKLFAQVSLKGVERSRNVDLKSIEELVLNKPFDPANFMDLHEKALTDNLICSIITPLVSNPGCAVVTNDRIYFQAAKGSASETNNWLINDVVATARRYHGLKDCAVELFMRDETSTCFSFSSSKERDLVLNLMPAEAVCHTDASYVAKALNLWINGELSNFDYLLVLNSAAGRSFHDLSRYPVFPWVIADYDSQKLDLKSQNTFRDLEKPIGALNSERLKYFTERMESMQDLEHPFLYGTHYSASGYVLYYLIRCMPEHMLCLQNGKFDAPDRIFHSVKQTYRSILVNHADVKELIPEFYDTSFGDEFLINVRNLPLGNTQLGDRVHDVLLPPWARSAKDFVRKKRKALESDLCSSKLQHWIDLVFGSNSRGEHAKEANNLFHKAAYFSQDDLDLMESEEERSHAVLQSMEFGCVPDCLFTSAHPGKGGQNVDESFVTSRW